MRLSVFGLVCLLVGLALSQTPPGSISLSNNAVFENTRSGSQDSFVVACDTNVHPISSIQSNTNLQSSVITVNLDNDVFDTDDQDLLVVLYDANGVPVCPTTNRDPTPTDFDDATLNACSFVCSDGDNCLVDYHCDFFVSGTYEVHVSQANTLAAVNNYTLTVYEWRETATDLGFGAEGGVFVENTVDSRIHLTGTDIDTSVPGPRTWRHYYVDLNRDLTHRGFHSTLRIRVENFVDIADVLLDDGDIAFCYSTSSFVGATDASTNGAELPCGDVCIEGDLSSDDFLEFEFLGCDVPSDELWLAVRTPSDPDADAGYDISIKFLERTIYPVHTITESELRTDNYVTAPDAQFCEPSEGRFTCEDYYEMSLDSIGTSASSFDGVLGPWFVAHAHGIANGEIAFVVNDDRFGGPKSECDNSPDWECGGDNGNTIPNDPENNGNGPFFPSNGFPIEEDEDCYVWIPPCRWNADYGNNWVTTVSGIDLDAENDRIFYGIDFSIFSMPHTTLSLTSLGPFFGNIRTGWYNHYSIQFADADIVPSSKFVAELYSSHEDHDLALFWNYGSHAGWNRDCLDYQGRCETLTDRVDYNIEPDFYYEHNYCRFAFFVCDHPAETSDVFSNDFRQVNDSLNWFDISSQPSGIRVDTLTSGTYYFSVLALRAPIDADSYDYESRYTLEFHYTAEEELWFDEPVLQHVWLNEYSTQFYVDMPDEEDNTVNGIQISISDVQNYVGETVSAHWECDALAGQCPCYTAQEVHTFDDTDHHVQFFIPRCACNGRVYVSVEARSPVGTISAQRPVGFVILATVDFRVSSSTGVTAATGTDLDVTRDTWAKVSGISRSTGSLAECRSCLQYQFYNLVFPTLQPGDALVGRLEFVPVVEDSTPSAWLYMLSDFSGDVINNGCDSSVSDLDGRIQACRARANLDPNWEGLPGEEWSFCQIVFEPCTADVDASSCYLSDNSFDDSLVQNRQFDQTRDWFAAIQTTGDDADSGIHFTFYVQIRSQLATGLTDGVAIQGHVFERTYQHYSIAVSGASNGNSLTVEFYSIVDQHGEIYFYINRASFAGHPQDCLSSIHRDLGLCEPCRLYTRAGDGDRTPASCHYQVGPCDLVDGSYFISAYQITDDSAVHSHTFFDDSYVFTMVAHVHGPEELLQDQGHPLTGHLWNWDDDDSTSQSTAYYTISLPSNLSPARLLFTLASVEATDVFVTITQDFVSGEYCRCSYTGYSMLDSTDILEWTRDWCNLESSEVYYVVVDGHSFDSTQPATFTVHAELNFFDIVPVTLINAGSNNIPLYEAPIAQTYTSDFREQLVPLPNPIAPIHLNWNQYRSFHWSVNTAPGRSMNVRFYQNTNETLQDIDYFFSVNEPRGLPSSNGLGGTAIGSTESCPGVDLIDSGNCQCDGRNNAQSWHISPCALTNEEYYLTLGGEAMEVNSFIDRIDIEITVIDASRILAVPGSAPDTATTDGAEFTVLFNSIDEDNELLENFQNRYLETVGSITLEAGEELEFDLNSSGGTMHVSFGDVPCGNVLCIDSNQCTFFACERITGTWWVLVEGANSATSLEITKRATETPDSTLSSSTLSTSEVGELPETFAGLTSNDEWRWHRITHSPSDDDLVRFFDFTPNTNDIYISLTGSEVYRPNLEDTGDNDMIAIYENANLGFGTTNPPNCGATQWTPDIDGVCCLDDVDVLFAISGQTDDYDLQLFVQALNSDSSVSSVSSSKSNTDTVGFSDSGDALARRGVQWYSFTISDDSNGFAYYFTTDDENLGGADFNVYSSVGRRAGSGDFSCPSFNENMIDPDQDPAICHGENDLDGLFSCTNIGFEDVCEGFIPSCIDCLSPGTEVYFAVESDFEGVASFTLAVEEHTGRSSFSLSSASGSASVSGSFPPSGLADFQLDNAFTGDSDAIYSHFVLDISVGYRDFAEMYPEFDNDLAASETFYFHLELQNIRQTSDDGEFTLSRARNEVEWFANQGAGLAGAGSCYAGTQVDNGFCDDYDEVDLGNEEFDFRCAIQAVNLFDDIGVCGFGSTWTISVGRGTDGPSNSLPDYSFSIEAFFSFNDTIANDYNLIDISPSSSQVTPGDVPSSFTTIDSNTIEESGPNDDQTDEAWFAIDTSSLGPQDYLRVWLRFTEEGLNLVSGMENDISDFDDFDFVPYVGYYTRGQGLEMEFKPDRGASDFTVYDDAARSDCGSIVFDADGEYICSVQFAPRDLAQFFGANGNQEFWMNLDFGSTIEFEYSFGIFVERRSANIVFDTVLDTDELTSTPSEASFVSDIVDREWQFFRAHIPVNHGKYSSLTGSVTDLFCGANLDIYSSFSGTADVDRPNRLPTPAQYVATSIDAAAFTIGENCLIDGGDYWIGVWANEDFQEFPDPIDVPSSSVDVTRPGTFTVGFTLSEYSVRRIYAECPYWDNAIDFDYRTVMWVEAENRGSQLTIQFSHDQSSATQPSWSFHASRNGYTWESGSCAWTTSQSGVDDPFTDEVHDYICTPGAGETFCSIHIPVCEFESARYYFWVDDGTGFASTTTLHIDSWLDRKNIPVAYLDPSFEQHDVASPYSVTWVDQLNFNSYYRDGGWQYYKVWVNAASNLEGLFDARLKVLSCDTGDCDLDMYVTRGPVGAATTRFDSISDPEFATGNCDVNDGDTPSGIWRAPTTCNCHDYHGDGTNRLAHGSVIIDSLCNAERDQYFIGVRELDSQHCVYELTVNVREQVHSLALDELICSEVSCVDYYKIDFGSIDTTYISTITVDLTSIDGDLLRLLGHTERIPYWQNHDVPGFPFDDSGSEISSCFTDIDTTVGDNLATITFGTCGAFDYYIAVQRTGADGVCDSCTNAAAYQLQVSAVLIDDSDEFFSEFTVSSFSILEGTATSLATSTGDCFVSCTRDILVPGVTYFSTGDVSVTSVNFGDLTTESVTFTGNNNDHENALYYVYTPDIEVSSFSIEMSSFDSTCGYGPDDIQVHVSTSASFPCDRCDDSDPLFASFTGDECGASSDTWTCVDDETYYIFVYSCTNFDCPASFDISLVETRVDAPTEIGSAHTGDFLEFHIDRECETDPQFYVDVEAGNPLSVQIREPLGGGDVAITLTLRSECTTIDTCTVWDTNSPGFDDGSDSSCRVEFEQTYSMYGCTPAGRYFIDVAADTPVDEYDYHGYQISAWNQWVSLSSSVDDVITGENRHFYSFGTSGGVKLVLEVVQGPSVDFRVTDRVCDDGVGSFQHHQQCGHGKCLVDISTEALYSGSDVFYIVITSGEIDFGRHTNVLGEKDTVYSLSLQTGGSACASRPSSGFCGASALDVDDAFTSGAFDISQSTWDYEFPEDRDEMARWRYESFISTRCPSPTDNCKRWLRRIACADAFPSCNSNGFLEGICEAACHEVEFECGLWLENEPRPEFGCLNGRYTTGQTGTCFTIPDRTPVPPAPVVITINPLDTCSVHIATLDSHLIGQDTRATACTSETLETLLYSEAGDLVIAGQIVTNEISGNDISVEVFGSDVESATSICVRIVNAITIDREAHLHGTCLQDAVAQLEEPNQLIGLMPVPTAYQAPTSVVDPPPAFTVPGFTIPSSFNIPGITIPDLQSVSSAAALVPSMVAALVAVVLVVL